MFNLKTALVSTTLAIASIGAFAQVSAITPMAPRVADERAANQHHRIEQGVASGQLSHREARRLREQQRAIRRAEAQARADGVVTRAERRQLDRMRADASRNIRHQKHDAQTARGR